MGVAKVSLLVRGEDVDDLSNSSSSIFINIQDQMSEQIRDIMEYNSTSMSMTYDRYYGVLRMTFDLPKDFAEASATMIRLAKRKTIEVDEQNLTPSYTVENSQEYYPVTSSTDLCELREVMSICPVGLQCQTDGSCMPITTPAPVRSPYAGDTNLYIVLGIAGGLTVSFLGFLVIFCYKKGIAAQKKYKNQTNREERVRGEPVDIPQHITDGRNK